MSSSGEQPEDSLTKPDAPPIRIARREALQYGGVGATIFGSPSAMQLGFDLTPRLQHLWMRVTSSGSAEFVAKFESDVNFPFMMPFVSKRKIERMASGGNISVDLKPIGFDPAGGTPDKRLLSGEISDFASQSTVEGTTVYTVSQIFVDADATNRQFPIVNPVDKIKPADFGRFVTLEFSDGYTYSLPPPGYIGGAADIYKRSNFLASDGGPPPLPFDGSPVDYQGKDQYLSLPHLTHRNDSTLAWMQRVAQLKYELLELPGIDHTTRDLYRPTWYGDQAIKKAYQVARHIGKELGKAAIEEVLLYKAPTVFTGPKDVVDIAQALEPEFAVPESDSDSTGESGGGLVDGIVDFFSGGGGGESDSAVEPPDEFRKAMQTPLNAVWMSEVVDPDASLSNIQSSGFTALYATTQFERAWNHMYATTDDSTALEQLRTLYTSTLEEQRNIAQQTRLNIESAASGPSGEYWEQLHKHALNLCEEVDSLAETQLELL